jgi:uncharacterized protein with HEPN domain
MLQRDENILRKIIMEIEYLEKLLADMSAEAFSADETIKRAAAMSAINIGELSKHLSETFHNEHPGNELRMAARTRDVYAHGYYSLSFDRVYETAKEDYPRVKAWILGILPEE